LQRVASTAARFAFRPSLTVKARFRAILAEGHQSVSAGLPLRNGESSNAGDAARATSLALVEAFRDLPAVHLAELERLLITQAVSRGEVLMRQGDAADALYLVASGRFAVNVDGRRIAEVGSGSPFGEIGFFADGIRTATVTALRDSIVLKLPKREFAAFAERHPIILKSIAVTLARRANTLTGDEQSLTHPRTLAVIVAGGFAMPDAFRKRLALALSRFGQIATVDSVTLAAALSGKIDVDSEAVTSWFNRQEALEGRKSDEPVTTKIRHFRISHYCEEARWALDWHGIAYEEINWPPGVHMVLAKSCGAKETSLPLLDGRTVIQGSGAIIDWTDRQTQDSSTAHCGRRTRDRAARRPRHWCSCAPAGIRRAASAISGAGHAWTLWQSFRLTQTFR
jgi:CRP-like cAMP-binding protein